MNTLTTKNGINVVYPAACKNYDKYIESYLDKYALADKAINEILNIEDDNDNDIKSIFFTCDSTYTGHGEVIYPSYDHAVIEITRAFIDGNYLCDPSLTIYPLLDYRIFRDAGIECDITDVFLYKTVFITIAVRRGILSDSYLIETLDDQKNLIRTLRDMKDIIILLIWSKIIWKRQQIRNNMNFC
ncbi:MAG: hypothetical protein VZR00_07215 [Lachnospiraceae bacterium]|nr:hypothetical protein [Lachnospiraceae bacterium]MEE3461658.1 hypothetical protein [Lachnospiraceae bacterium]